MGSEYVHNNGTVWFLRGHHIQCKCHNADSSLYQSQLVSMCSHSMKD